MCRRPSKLPTRLSLVGFPGRWPAAGRTAGSEVDAYCSKNSCWAEAEVVATTATAITVRFKKWAEVEEVIARSDVANRVAPHKTASAVNQ